MRGKKNARLYIRVDAKRPLFSDHKFRRLSGTYLNIERVILPLSDNDASIF